MKIRPAMTAIAAVIALSSTPLIAQVADEPIAETPAPVVETTPAPVTEDPLAPATAAEPTTAADPLAAEPAPAPVARKATTARSTAARSRPAPARTASAAPTVAAAPPAATIDPSAVTPAEPPLPAEPVIAPIAEPVEPAPATADTMAMDEVIPIAGGGALGLLVLAGAGLAVRRRRRRAEAAEFEARQEYAESLAEPEMGEPKPGYMPEQAEPAFVRAFAPTAAAPEVAPAATPSPSPDVDGPVTALPEGFDLSKFGPHVQAAYKGPTEDNPSLSLKYRLRRATAMDQMARKDATESGPAKAPVAGPAVPQRDKVDFMLARSGTKPSARPASITNGRPAYSN